MLGASNKLSVVFPIRWFLDWGLLRKDGCDLEFIRIY